MFTIQSRITMHEKNIQSENLTMEMTEMMEETDKDL